MNTRISYMYRDASNYKQYGGAVVEGRVTYEELEPYLMDGVFFIPNVVGLPDLTEKFREQGYEFPNDDDHELHELEGCVPTEEEPDIELSSGELKKRLQKHQP